MACVCQNRYRWTVASSVGKLVEARLTATESEAVAAFLAAITEAVANAKEPVVGILDLTEVRVFGQADAERLVAVMRKDNPRVERTAIIVNGDRLLTMQMQRLVRAAAWPCRQVFRDATRAIAWLGEVLGPEEVARAHAFMTQ